MCPMNILAFFVLGKSLSKSLLTGDGRLLLHPSGTEPIFRCFAEARSDKRAEELANLGMQELKSCIRKRAGA